MYVCMYVCISEKNIVRTLVRTYIVYVFICKRKKREERRYIYIYIKSFHMYIRKDREIEREREILKEKMIHCTQRSVGQHVFTDQRRLSETNRFIFVSSFLFLLFLFSFFFLFFFFFLERQRCAREHCDKTIVCSCFALTRKQFLAR